MKTEIFADRAAFRARADKSINGVTAEFAAENPGWDEERNNKACWNCSDCSGCFGCSRCSDCSDCSDCFGCSRCSGCFGCSRCSDCSDCSDCFDCSDCSDCSRCSGCSDCSDCSDCSRCSGCFGLVGAHPVVDAGAPAFVVPVIPNIHQAVQAAIVAPGHKLKMDTWHTCETTHCRGGWVVALAGEAGKELEDRTSTLFAAMQIYKASSPIRVSPPRFFEGNETALADIERCANVEREATVPA